MQYQYQECKISSDTNQIKLINVSLSNADWLVSRIHRTFL